MVEQYLAAASSYASDIDGLILLIAIIVGVWFVACELLFVGFIVKFRRKKHPKAQYISGELKHEKRWVTIPHLLVLVCDVFIIVGAVRVWYDVKQDLPEPDRIVRVIGQQWAWTFIHPGKDGKIDTDDDISLIDELHVEKDLVYHFKLEALDVMHSFSVPVFRLKQDAIPGREITGWFKAILTGTHDIQCAEMCGVGHGIMSARIFIESPQKHAAWLADSSRATLTASSAPPALPSRTTGALP